MRVLPAFFLAFAIAANCGGSAALPRVFELAAQRGLYVEVVALAGTKEQSLTTDAIREHVSGVGRIAADQTNALIELANENAHPTQVAELKDPAFLRELRALISADVLVSFGSNCCGEGASPAEYPTPLRAGDYLTVHADRSEISARRLSSLAALRDLSDATKRYVVADEPIGAASATSPVAARRNPMRFSTRPPKRGSSG